MISFFRNSGLISEVSSLNLYLNITLAVSEQIINKTLRSLTKLHDISNSSSILEISLSTPLVEYPHTLEYIQLASHYSSAILKSWTESITRRSWFDVRF